MTLQETIELRKAERVAANRQAREDLANNIEYVNVQVKLELMKEEIAKLNKMIIQLNSIKDFVANDGRKFGINVFPVSAFGPGLGQLIGIIQGSKGAFTDEMALEYETIVGVNHLELTMAADALGTTDYFKHSIITQGEEGDEVLFLVLLRGIANKLNIIECLPSDDEISKLITKWQITSAQKAKRQAEESKLAEDLDTEAFTLED